MLWNERHCFIIPRRSNRCTSCHWTHKVCSKLWGEVTILHYFRMESQCSVCSQPMVKERTHYGAVSCYSCRAFFWSAYISCLPSPLPLLVPACGRLTATHAGHSSGQPKSCPPPPHTHTYCTVYMYSTCGRLAVTHAGQSSGQPKSCSPPQPHTVHVPVAGQLLLIPSIRQVAKSNIFKSLEFWTK